MLAATTLALAISASVSPVTLAVPGFVASGVDPSVASSISARFAQELAKTPLEVVTDAALKADAILLGRVSTLDTEYHVDLRVLDDGEGKLLAIYSVDAGEDRLGEQLAQAADVVANAVLIAHDRPGIDVGEPVTGDLPKPATLPKRATLPKHALTLSPLACFVGFFGAEYEGVLSDQLSAFASATLIWFDDRFLSIHGYLLSLGMRWYPWREAPSGFFLDGEVRLGDARWLDSLDEDLPYSGGSFAVLPSAMVGYTFLFGEIPLSFGLGLGYNGVLDYGFWSEIGPIVRISTGVTF